MSGRFARWRDFGFAVAALAGVAAAPAEAQDRQNLSKSALSGQWIRVEGFYHLNPDCTNVGHPTVKIVSGPSAGDVSVRQEKAFPSFAADNSRARCNTQRVPAVAVYYKSHRRFIGSDQFSLEVYWTDGDLWTRTVSIDVK